jgi:hypothetical protein
MASGVKFRREVWGLDFAFKPLRIINVGGRPVWYLLYAVRNSGQTLEPVVGEDGIVTAKPGKGEAIRFIPRFVLESHDRMPNGERVNRRYLDRILPEAVSAIRQREMRGGELFNTAEMAEHPIPVSSGRMNQWVWGVATWSDVDPRMDFFAVYVGGLTNAYRWEDVPGAYRPGDPVGSGRRFARKTLQLNFWRPGDELLLSEREIRYGVPLDHAELYGVRDGVAYQWVYR